MTVTSNATGASVKIVTGAAVVAEGKISENGSYTTPTKLPAGTYTVTVSKIGYKEVTKTVIVDKDIIEAINLEEVPAVDGAVSAIDNSKIYIDGVLKVTSKDDVIIDGKPAKEITVRKDGSVIATAAENMTPGSKYEVTVYGAVYSIVAKPADSVPLAVESAKALSCTVVEVVLNAEDGDDLSVKDPANYVFDNGLKAVSVDYKKKTDGNFDKSIVRITTTMQTDGQAYKLKADGISDLAGNVSKDVSATFAGIGEDKDAPEVASAVSSKGNTVEVTFKDASMLESTALADKTNYYIDGLTINNLVVNKNELGESEKKVTLFTSTQTPAKIYTLKVGNIADIYGNKMTKTAEKQFAGTELDKEPPAVEGAEAETNTTVIVKLNDVLDKATAENPANYKISGLTVSKADLIVDYTDELKIYNSKWVKLTTSSQTAGKVYEVSVSGVKDAAGNVITTEQQYTAEFAGVPVDTDKPYVTNVTSEGKNKIRVQFNEKVDYTTAKNPLNYYIDNNIGYVTAAKVVDNGTAVELTTATQEAGKVYTLTVNSVKDLSGNVIAVDSKSTFVGFDVVSNDIKIASAVALNNRQVQVTFNKDIKKFSKDANIIVKKNGANDSDALDLDTTTRVKPVNTKTYIITLADNNTFDSSVYQIIIKDEDSDKKVEDFCDNSIDGTKIKAAEAKFGGIKAKAPSINITSVTQVAAKVLRVTFNQKVKAQEITDVNLEYSDGTTSLKDGTIEATTGATDNVLVTFGSKIALKKSATLKILNSSGASDTDKITDGTTGVFKMTEGLAEGKVSYDFTFGTGEYETKDLKMTHAQAVDKRTIDVTYNLEVKADKLNTDSYYIETEDGVKVVESSNIASVKILSSKVVRIYLKDTAELKAGTVYYVKTDTTNSNAKNPVTDLDGSLDDNSNSTIKAENLTAKFAMSSKNHDAAKLISAQVLDQTHVKVVFSEKVKGLNESKVTDFVLYYGDKLDKTVQKTNGTISKDAFSKIACVDETSNGAVYVLTLNSTVGSAFIKDVKYAVAMKDDSSVTDENNVAKVNVGTAADPIKVTFGGIGELLTASVKVNATHKEKVDITADTKLTAQYGIKVVKDDSGNKTIDDAFKNGMTIETSVASDVDPFDGVTAASDNKAVVLIAVKVTNALTGKDVIKYFKVTGTYNSSSSKYESLQIESVK